LVNLASEGHRREVTEMRERVEKASAAEKEVSSFG
jgi:hypothetical protein